jgi:hypothetical protein
LCHAFGQQRTGTVIPANEVVRSPSVRHVDSRGGTGI